MRFWGQKSHVIGAVALVAVLAGCQTTTVSNEPVGYRKEFRETAPESFLTLIADLVWAESIADECPSIRFNKRAEEDAIEASIVLLESKGYIESDFDYWENSVSDKQIQDDVLRRLLDSGAVLSQPQSFCKVGLQEIAAGSDVGSYLIKR